jgi:hypothetical protein
VRGARSPIQWVAEALSPEEKKLGDEVDHSPPSSAKVKNEYNYTSYVLYAFTVCRQKTLPIFNAHM